MIITTAHMTFGVRRSARLQMGVKARVRDVGPYVAEKPILAQWEADDWVQLQVRKTIDRADRAGVSVGLTPGSQAAIAELEDRIRADLRQRYLIIESVVPVKASRNSRLGLASI